MKTLVSIIIPSFNQGRFIRDTIESCLAQDYRPLEILVIDGASTDGTLHVLHQYDHVPEVKWISERDSGVAEAVNKGFALARGEIGGIQSSDDAYLPGSVRLAVEQFELSPELGLVFGDCTNVDTEGHETSCFRSSPFSIETFLCKSTLILQPATFFRLRLARDLGGWNSDYFNCDTEMWLRLVFRAPARKIDAVLGRRLIHDQQRNKRASEIVDSNFRMVNESTDIASAPRRLRHAAQCGSFLTAAVYHPCGGGLKRYYYWRAVLAFPDVLKTQPKLIGALIPGYWYVYPWLVRARRAIGKVMQCLIKCKNTDSESNKGRTANRTKT